MKIAVKDGNQHSIDKHVIREEDSSNSRKHFPTTDFSQKKFGKSGRLPV
jgi:hypothetical protein